MDALEVIDRFRAGMEGTHVFGEPVVSGDTTVIPAAKVRGGGGGGGGGKAAEGTEGATGSGSGFGLQAVPVGAFVVSNGKIRWKPVVDLSRIALGWQLVVALGLIAFSPLFRARFSGARRPARRLLRRALRHA